MRGRGLTGSIRSCKLEPVSLHKEKVMKMKPHNPVRWSPRRLMLSLGFGVAVLSALALSAFGGSQLPNPLNSPDPSGVLSTFNTAGGVDISNPFFQSLGT